MRLSVLLLVVAFAACHPAPKEATDEELKPVDVDPNAPVPKLGVVNGDDAQVPTVQRRLVDPSTPRDTPREGRPQWHEGDGLGTVVDKSIYHAKSDASGPVASIIYVTETGDRGGPKTSAVVVFSSDEDSPLMSQRPTPRRVLKALTRPEMKKLLEDLKASGLDQLPLESQEANDPVGQDRQIVVFRDGKRVTFRRSATQNDARQFTTFRAVEQVLVNDAHDVAPYVQVQGRTDVEHFKPLNEK